MRDPWLSGLLGEEEQGQDPWLTGLLDSQPAAPAVATSGPPRAGYDIGPTTTEQPWGTYPLAGPPSRTIGERMDAVRQRIWRANRLREEDRPDETFGEFLGELTKPRKFVATVPYVGTGVEVYELGRALLAAHRMEEGTADIDDWEALTTVYEQQVDRMRGKTTAATAASIISGSIPWMGEILATSGVLGALKVGGKKLTKEVAERTLANGLKTLAKGAVKLGGKTAKRLPFFSHRVAAGTLERMLPQDYRIKADEGTYELIVAEPGKPFLSALKDSAIDVYIELYSEFTGEPIGAIASHVLRKAGIPPLRMSVQEFLRSVGFHGVLGEMSEERMAEILKASATWLGMADLPQHLPTLKQIAAEGIAFPAMMGAAGAASVAGGLVTRAEADRMARETPEATEAAIKTAGSRKLGEFIDGADLASREERVATVEVLKQAQQSVPPVRVEFPEPRIEREMRGPTQVRIPEPRIEAQFPRTKVEFPEPRIEAAAKGIPTAEPVLPEKATPGTRRMYGGVEFQAYAGPKTGQIVWRRTDAQAMAPPGLRTPAETLGMVSMEDVLDTTKRSTSKTKKFLRRWFLSTGHLPEYVFRRRNRKRNEVEAQRLLSSFARRDFYKAAKKTYGGWKRATPRDIQPISDYLSGHMPIDVVPEPMREPTMRLRSHLDALISTLVREGLVEERLIPAIDASKGIYLYRPYRVHVDPVWSEKVPLEIRNTMKARLREEHPDHSEDEIEGLIEHFLFEDKAADTPIGNWRRSGLSEEDSSILKERKLDEQPELRALYGEETEPLLLYLYSVHKLAAVIANRRFLRDIRENGLGQYFFERPRAEGRFIARIARDDKGALAPLANLYTTPEIAQALEEGYGSNYIHPLARLYMMANLSAKLSKTTLSHMTHERNTLANLHFAMCAGHWSNIGKTGLVIGAGLGTIAGGLIGGPLGAATGLTLGGLTGSRIQLGAKPGLAALKFVNDPTARDEAIRLTRLGILNSSAVAGELRAMLKDATIEGFDNYVYRKIMKAVKAGTDLASGLYAWEDNIWKVAGQYDEEEAYGRALPDVPRETIEDDASWRVQNMYPTYAMVPRVTRLLRAIPLISTFPSFVSEFFRCSYNILDITQKELRDPRLHAIGAKRLVGTMLAFTAPQIAALTWRMLQGISRQDDDDIRRCQPYWSENSTIIHLGQVKPGVYEKVDLSYIAPSSYLTDAFTAALRGDQTWKQRFLNGFLELVKPFSEEEMVMERLLDIGRNQKKRGGRVYNPEEPGVQPWLDAFNWVWRVFEPGEIGATRRLLKSVSKAVEPTGKVYDFRTEALAYTTGHRISRVDVAQSLSYQLSHFNDRLSRVQKILNKVVNLRGPVTNEEIETAYNRMEAARRNLFDEYHELIRSKTRLGLRVEQIRQILNASNISRQKGDDMLYGTYHPYMPSVRYLSTAQARANAAPQSGAASSREFERRRRLVQSLARRRNR